MTDKVNHTDEALTLFGRPYHPGADPLPGQPSRMPVVALSDLPTPPDQPDDQRLTIFGETWEPGA